MPAPVPEESHDGEAAETQHSEHHPVEGLEARIRDEGREEKNGGEKTSDCGSAIWWPAKMNGAQNGHSPRWNDWARNWSCG